MMSRRALSASAALLAATFGAGTAHADPHRILVYGDSNTWGYEARSDGAPAFRLPPDRRWTGILQHDLGPGYVVVENGLNLRTTNLDGQDWAGSVIRPDTVNGARHLPVSIAANMPIDLVVIMLGTNDLQARYERSPRAVAEAGIALARTVEASAGGIGTAYPSPRVLLVSPVQIGSIPIEEWSRRYAGAREKSAGFSAAFRNAARDAGIAEFDAAAAIGGAVHGADGLHLSEADHRSLAAGIAPVIRRMLNAR